MNIRRLLSVLLIPFLLSCATITVNVYFPEKDVEAAYEDIESALDFDVVPKKDTAAASKPKNRSSTFFGATAAWAAEPKININAELEKMEEVQESLARRKERLETLARILDARLVGLGTDGMIEPVPADLQGDTPASSSEFFPADAETGLMKFIAAENKDRKILIRGMAVATLRAMKKDEKNKEDLGHYLSESAEKFREAQIRKIKVGWFYRDDDGKWKQLEPVEEEGEEKPAKGR